MRRRELAPAGRGQFRARGGDVAPPPHDDAAAHAPALPAQFSPPCSPLPKRSNLSSARLSLSLSGSPRGRLTLLLPRVHAQVWPLCRPPLSRCWRAVVGGCLDAAPPRRRLEAGTAPADPLDAVVAGRRFRLDVPMPLGGTFPAWLDLHSSDYLWGRTSILRPHCASPLQRRKRRLPWAPPPPALGG